MPKYRAVYAAGGSGAPGPAGPAGPAGATGPAGPTGTNNAFYIEQSFATATTAWVVMHNKNTYAVDVETIDGSGVDVEGDVTRPDKNTIRIDFFHAKTGIARVSGLANT